MGSLDEFAPAANAKHNLVPTNVKASKALLAPGTLKKITAPSPHARWDKTQLL
jgi:hypothetical protein